MESNTVYMSSTMDAKAKGDEGIYAAMDAAHLARVLRGLTVSNLTLRESIVPYGSSPASPNGATFSAATPGEVVMAAPPAQYTATPIDTVFRTARWDALYGGASAAAGMTPEERDTLALVASFEADPPVGLPGNEEALEAFMDVLPLARYLKPGHPLDFDALRRLLAVLEHDAAKMVTLDLTEVVIASAQPEPSITALQEKLAQLEQRYPLPVKKPAADDDDSGGSNSEEEGEDGDDDDDGSAGNAGSAKHNAALQARCEALQIPYTNYRAALLALASYEMRVWPILCRYLGENRRLRVLVLAKNKLGTESSTSEGSVALAPLRALARLIDENETLQVLDLKQNDLGPLGVGIVAKALTKNIALVEVDLSENALNSTPLEPIEDPEYEEEDAVFGEMYQGLEGLSEVLKKNKFIRVLRLARNGIHAGDDLTAPPPEEDVMADYNPAQDAYDPSMAEAWADVPLWKLVSPLQRFHRLEVLDLSGNQLGVLGARMLATALATNHSLKVLDLTDNGIGFRGLHYIAELVLCRGTTTTTAAAAENGVVANANGTAYSASVLPSATVTASSSSSPPSQSALHTLILRRNDLGGKATSKSQQRAAKVAMARFAEGLRGNRTLRRLILSHNHLGADLCATLLSSIDTAEALEELDISYNEACGPHPAGFTPEVVQLLSRALHQRPSGTVCPLRRVRLAGNNVCPSGAAILFPPELNPSTFFLEELDLSLNALEDALEPLGNLLAANAVARLDLSFNNTTSAHALAGGLAQNHSLVKLNLSHNRLGSCDTLQRISPEQQAAGFQRFLSLIAGHPALRELSLSWNDLNDAHGDAILSVLAPPTSLPQFRLLDLRQNPRVPVSTVQQLLVSVAARPGMEVLYLSAPIGLDESATAATLLMSVAGVVQQSPSLLDVNCGLREATLGRDVVDVESSEVGQYVEVTRRRLLLNALAAAAQRHQRDGQ